MAQYAEDAKQHDEPWELWQHGDDELWTNCSTHPSRFTDHHYRRKPRTIQLGDYEVPEPCKVELEYGQDYYIPSLSAGASWRTWNDDKHDANALESNLVHLDRRSAAPQANQADALDAARYRFLRDTCWSSDKELATVISLQMNKVWDEKIDEAMARNKKE